MADSALSKAQADLRSAQRAKEHARDEALAAQGEANAARAQAQAAFAARAQAEADAAARKRDSRLHLLEGMRNALPREDTPRWLVATVRDSAFRGPALSSNLSERIGAPCGCPIQPSCFACVGGRSLGHRVQRGSGA